MAKARISLSLRIVTELLMDFMHNFGIGAMGKV